MKIPRLAVAPFAILVFAGILDLAAAAQTSASPDITGTWTLDLSKSKPDKRFPVKSQTVVITSSGQTIQFNYTTDGKPLSFTYVIDGKEHITPIPAPPSPDGTKQPPNPMFKDAENIIKAEWKKSALDIVTISRMGPLGNNIDSLFLSQHWTLSPDGKTLTEKTGSDFDSGHLYVYEKQ